MKINNFPKLIVGLAIIELAMVGCGQDSGLETYNSANSIEGSSEPATITNTAQSPAEMRVGDVYSVTFSKSESSAIDFSGVDSSSQFVFVVSAIDSGQNTHSLQMYDASAVLDISADGIDIGKGFAPISGPEAFEQQLRNAEAILSNDMEMKVAGPVIQDDPGKAAVSTATGYSIGDAASFYVLSSISSLSSYKIVRSTIRCVGNNVVFYVDDEVSKTNPGDLTDADVKTLCEDFDTIIDKEYELFGEPSDVNGDQKIAVLMTPQVNRLGASGGGIITGFFFANDLYTSADSNKREIIYTHVPDSGGQYGVTIPKSFAMNNLLPAVLPHELQHAISYNNKVFVNGGSAEENWLNEAMSHFSEDILGFGNENPSRVEVFLSNPSYYGPISSGSPNLAERAASYLFIRFLYEQADDKEDFIWNLIHSKYTGVQNVEYSFAGQSDDFDQISEFLLRWDIALAMSSFGLSADPAFSYKERVYNDETENWEGVCLDCNTDDGRGTILNGVQLSQFYSVNSINLEPTASKFFKVTSFPVDIDFSTKTEGLYAASLIRYK